MVKIFVGNCSSDSTGDDLMRCFSKYGRVTQADILEGKGFGFVHMDSTDNAQSAVAALDGMELQGRKLRVELSAGRREGGGGPMHSSRGGGSRGGGFRGDGRSFGDGGRGRGGGRGSDRGGFGRGGGRGGRGGGGYDREDRGGRGGDRGAPRRDYGGGGRDYNRGRSSDQYTSRYSDAPPFQQSRLPEPPAPYYEQSIAPPPTRQPPSAPYPRTGSGEGVYYERRPLPDNGHGSRPYNNAQSGFNPMQAPIQQIYPVSMNVSGVAGYTGVYEDSRNFRQM